MGTNKLASDLSILQAIRQCSYTYDDETQETIPASMWMTAHHIFYRVATTSEINNALTNNSSSTSTVNLASSNITTDATASNNTVSDTINNIDTSSTTINNNLPNLRRRDHKGMF